MPENKKTTGLKEPQLDEMNLLELYQVSAMPDDVYEEIRIRIGLALSHLKAGAINIAADILRTF
jgi:hypothetical protein